MFVHALTEIQTTTYLSAEIIKQIGGYEITYVDNLDEAIAVAARLPSARKGTAEIHPPFKLATPPQPTRGDPHYSQSHRLV